MHHDVRCARPLTMSHTAAFTSPLTLSACFLLSILPKGCLGVDPAAKTGLVPLRAVRSKAPTRRVDPLDDKAGAPLPPRNAPLLRRRTTTARLGRPRSPQTNAAPSRTDRRSDRPPHATLDQRHAVALAANVTRLNKLSSYPRRDRSGMIHARDAGQAMVTEINRPNRSTMC